MGFNKYKTGIYKIDKAAYNKWLKQIKITYNNLNEKDLICDEGVLLKSIFWQYTKPLKFGVVQDEIAHNVELFISKGNGPYPRAKVGGLPKDGYLLHHVVFEACRWSRKDGYEIHHIDGNVLNVEINNLQYLTQEEHLAIHNKINRNKRDTRKCPWLRPNQTI